MDTVLVTGGSGLLGCTLVPLLKLKKYKVVTLSQSSKAADVNADLTNYESLKKSFDQINPKAIVNLAGLTDVDLCEKSPNLSYKTNVKVVENISSWLKNNGEKTHLIQISTDQVYDGEGLHLEEDVTITNHYALSKYAGELAALNSKSTVLRTNFFGKSLCATRTSLSDWVVTSLNNASKIQVFNDVIFSPLSMDFLSDMIILVLEKQHLGVFNLGSRLGLSKADFAFKLAEVLKLDLKNISRTTTDKVNFLKTYRPKNMCMDTNKFEKKFGVKLPSLESEIENVGRKYYEKK